MSFLFLFCMDSTEYTVTYFKIAKSYNTSYINVNKMLLYLLMLVVGALL